MVESQNQLNYLIKMINCMKFTLSKLNDMALKTYWYTIDIKIAENLECSLSNKITLIQMRKKSVISLLGLHPPKMSKQFLLVTLTFIFDITDNLEY